MSCIPFRTPSDTAGDRITLGTSAPWHAYANEAPISARMQLRLIAHVSRWLADEGLAASDLTSA